MKSKYPKVACAMIVTCDGQTYDVGEVFFYGDEKEFFAGANALYEQVFKEDYYIVNDGMGVNVIPINRIATIRIDRDIPTV